MIRTDKSFNDFNWVETEALTDEERTALAEQYG